MFSSRALLRSLRALPRLPPTRAGIHPPPSSRHLPSPAQRRFESNFRRFPPPPPPRRPQKIIYTRFDPEHARHAKPLITIEGIKGVVTSGPSKILIIFVIGSTGLFYFSHLETVPVSGRRRFMCWSEDSMEEQGRLMYAQIMHQVHGAILPEWDARSRMVNRVMDRLVQSSDLENVQWEVNVIHSNEINAFVIPGGKVFVYSGLLNIAKTDDQLATILGHEIAHTLARHPAERASQAVFVIIPLQAMFLLLDSIGITAGFGQFIGQMLLDLGVSRRASRVQESEADYIGLMMMARSCYNPQAAVEVWKRMEEANKSNVPEWMSTHPSDVNRVSSIRGWLTKAQDARESSDCAATLDYQRQFKGAMGDFRGLFGS